MNMQVGEEPTANERPHDADCNVSNQSKAGALNDLPGEPTGNQANKQNHKKCLPRHNPLPLAIPIRGEFYLISHLAKSRCLSNKNSGIKRGLICHA
jgi:hypothetical protein